MLGYGARIRCRMSLERLHRTDDMLRTAGVANSPARDGVALGEGVYQNRLALRLFRQLHNIAMRGASPHQVRIAFIEADPDLTLQSNLRNPRKLFRVIDQTSSVFMP